jgi:hypothetical protein
MIAPLRGWARSNKRDVHALYLAGCDPRTPWYAKALGGKVLKHFGCLGVLIKSLANFEPVTG